MGGVNCNCMSETRDTETCNFGDRINFTPYEVNKLHLTKIQSGMKGWLARKNV